MHQNEKSYPDRNQYDADPQSLLANDGNSLFRRLGGQLRRPGAYWRKNWAQGRRCYHRCTILPRLNSLKWSVLLLSVGFGSLLCRRRKDTTKFRKLAIFSKKSVQCPPTLPIFWFHEQSKKEAMMLSLVQVRSEFTMIVTSWQLIFMVEGWSGEEWYSSRSRTGANNFCMVEGRGGEKWYSSRKRTGANICMVEGRGGEEWYASRTRTRAY